MSNDQVKNKLDDVQLSVSETLQSLRKILKRTQELDELEKQLNLKPENIVFAESVRKIKSGFMDDIDAHIDSLSKLLSEYQEVVSETI